MTISALFVKGIGSGTSNNPSVTHTTLKAWGRSFGWKQRIQEREIEIAREVASRNIADEVNHRERSLKIVNVAMVKLAKGIVNETVKMNMADLDRLVRLEKFLRGEPDSREAIVFPDLKDKSRDEIQELVREELEVLKELGAGEAVASDGN